jgi:hypothetical protein
MSMQQVLAYHNAFTGTIHIDFTADFQTTIGGGTAGADPATGSDLVVFVKTQGFENPTAVHTSDGTNELDAGVATTADFTAQDIYSYKIAGIDAATTAIKVTMTGSDTIWVVVVEDNETLTENFSSPYDDTGDGFSVQDKNQPYTTDEADELVIVVTNSNLNTLGTGVTAAQHSSEANHAGLTKEPTAAESGNVQWNKGTDGSVNALTLTFTHAAAGGGVPIFQNYYRQHRA